MSKHTPGWPTREWSTMISRARRSLEQEDAHFNICARCHDPGAARNPGAAFCGDCELAIARGDAVCVTNMGHDGSCRLCRSARAAIAKARGE